MLFLRDDDSDPENKSTPSGANMAIIFEDGSRLIIESKESLTTLEIH